jgi:hypothetical protein
MLAVTWRRQWRRRKEKIATPTLKSPKAMGTSPAPLLCTASIQTPKPMITADSTMSTTVVKSCSSHKQVSGPVAQMMPACAPVHSDPPPASGACCRHAHRATIRSRRLSVSRRQGAREHSSRPPQRSTTQGRNDMPTPSPMVDPNRGDQPMTSNTRPPASEVGTTRRSPMKKRLAPWPTVVGGSMRIISANHRRGRPGGRSSPACRGASATALFCPLEKARISVAATDPAHYGKERCSPRSTLRRAARKCHSTWSTDSPRPRTSTKRKVAG